MLEKIFEKEKRRKIKKKSVLVFQLIFFKFLIQIVHRKYIIMTTINSDNWNIDIVVDSI